MGQSLSKILTKLLFKHPLSNKKGLDIYVIYDEKFELVPSAQFFMEFLYKNSKDFLCLKIALTRPIFVMEHSDSDFSDAGDASEVRQQAEHVVRQARVN